MPGGKDENINLTNFQQFSSTFFAKSMDFANESADIFSSSYINFKRKSAGYLTRNEVNNVLMDTISAKKQLKELNYLYNNTCLVNWDTEKIKSRLDIPDNTYIFPNQKQFNKFKDGQVSDIKSLMKKDKKYPMFTLLGCHKLERDSKELNKLVSDNKKILGATNLTSNQEKEIEQLEKIARIQYHTVAEQGFLAIPQVAVTNIVTDGLGMFRAKADRNDLRANSEKQIKNNNLDDGFAVTKAVFGNLAYMMVPGASAIKDFVADNTKFFKDIPIIGKISKLLSNATGVGVAVKIMKFLVTYLPVVALSMASLMVIGWYFISVFIYFLVSPFIVIYAMSQQQTDIIKNFLIRGVALSFKPILIILSIVVAVLAIELFKDLSIILFDTNFALLVDTVKEETFFLNPLDWFFVFLKGVIDVGVSIVATVSAFYLVFNGAEMILGMFGFKDVGIDVKEVVGGAVENLSLIHI